MPKFTVDTHLFRELGALLVGRDSTALVELIKNSYDADATHVNVFAENLSTGDQGRVVIVDDGAGMTKEQFEQGFLRIASRWKERDQRRSRLFKRRFTGAKGIGRLAAHKLASILSVTSVAMTKGSSDSRAIIATIDWDKIEALETLDDVGQSNAIVLRTEACDRSVKPGTTIELRRLRRKWTDQERVNFFHELQHFRPPGPLLTLSSIVPQSKRLFKAPYVVDSKKRADPGFVVDVGGEFDTGEEYWQDVVQVADWLLEIDALSDPGRVRYLITPTGRQIEKTPSAKSERRGIAHPDPQHGPFFQARILIREGASGLTGGRQSWLGRAAGIRVYLEGFRVLPYGERGNDWLEIDADYTLRQRTLRYLDAFPAYRTDDDKDAALSALRHSHYYGAAFLTLENARHLRMVVNREGFVPEAAFYNLKTIIRRGIDLSVRVRAKAGAERRHDRRVSRAATPEPTSKELRELIEQHVSEATAAANEARKQAAAGDYASAKRLIDDAASRFASGSEAHDRLLSERSMMRILASIGLQLAQFVHEVNSLLGTAQSIENAMESLRRDTQLPPNARREVASIQGSVHDLRRAVERQASYLTDVTSADARRRRSRQNYSERFESAIRLLRAAADRRGIEIVNAIPDDAKSPPMFQAEVSLVFTNLLSNAIKAARKGGRIRGTARVCGKEGGWVIRVENTGRAVNVQRAERWFRPFETTTTQSDPVLGQGMGMGLPITRQMLEEYGATVQFTKPSAGFATAIELRIPGD